MFGDSFAAAGCCAGLGVSAAVCVIGLQLLCVALEVRFRRKFPK